jgi:hypothetical protein
MGIPENSPVCIAPQRSAPTHSCIKGGVAVHVMDVPALLSIYNRITFLVDGDRVRPDLEKQLAGREPNGDSHTEANVHNEPVGSFPQPKFKCRMASIAGRLDLCRVCFVEYDDSETLIVDIVYEYGDSGGTSRLNTVCKKNAIGCTAIETLYRALKEIPIIAQTVLEVYGGIVTMELTYPHMSRGNPNVCSKPRSTIIVPVQAPRINPAASILFTQFVNRNHNITVIGNRFVILGSQFHDGLITYLDDRVFGPAPDDFSLEGQLSDENP